MFPCSTRSRDRSDRDVRGGRTVPPALQNGMLFYENQDPFEASIPSTHQASLGPFRRGTRHLLNHPPTTTSPLPPKKEQTPPPHRIHNPQTPSPLSPSHPGLHPCRPPPWRGGFPCPWAHPTPRTPDPMADTTPTPWAEAADTAGGVVIPRSKDPGGSPW